jgi:hypothetical protein
MVAAPRRHWFKRPGHRREARLFGADRALGDLRVTEPPPPTLEQWIAARSRPDGDCRRWTGSHNNFGYAKYERQGRSESVHRLVWEHYHGPIPAGAVVAHSCPHRDCVKETHMYLTDAGDRASTTASLGHMAHGEKHWNHKLTWQSVRLIRTSHESTHVLADQFGVTTGAIKAVRAWRTWRRPPPPTDEAGDTVRPRREAPSTRSRRRKV